MKNLKAVLTVAVAGVALSSLSTLSRHETCEKITVLRSNKMPIPKNAISQEIEVHAIHCIEEDDTNRFGEVVDRVAHETQYVKEAAICKEAVLREKAAVCKEAIAHKEAVLREEAVARKDAAARRRQELANCITEEAQHMKNTAAQNAAKVAHRVNEQAQQARDAAAQNLVKVSHRLNEKVHHAKDATTQSVVKAVHRVSEEGQQVKDAAAEQATYVWHRIPSTMRALGARVSYYSAQIRMSIADTWHWFRAKIARDHRHTREEL